VSDGKFWHIKCPGCGKAIFRWQDEPPESATCGHCGTVVPGPEPDTVLHELVFTDREARPAKWQTRCGRTDVPLEQTTTPSPHAHYKVTCLACLAEHFPGCHPEHAEDRREVPPAAIEDTEPCWHCGTPTTRGECRCPDCWDSADHIPVSAIYHCRTCGRWWAWMTGLNITTITFGDESATAHQGEKR